MNTPPWIAKKISRMSNILQRSRDELFVELFEWEILNGIKYTYEQNWERLPPLTPLKKPGTKRDIALRFWGELCLNKIRLKIPKKIGSFNLEIIYKLAFRVQLDTPSDILPKKAKHLYQCILILLRSKDVLAMCLVNCMPYIILLLQNHLNRAFIPRGLHCMVN